jgi:hypothetical protein
MGQVLVSKEYLQGIADAIRTKNGLTTKYTPAEMPNAIINIPGGGSAPTIDSLSVTPSATTQTFNSSSVDGYKPVTVLGDADLVADNIKKGVQIFNTTGTYNPFEWMGADVECLNPNLYNATVQLSSTAYSSWTASTTAKSLKATTSLSAFSADMAHYAYLLRWVTVAHVALIDGATHNTVPEGLQINLFDQQIMRRPSSLANIQADNYNGNVYVNTAALGWMQYYTTKSAYTYTWASSYGFYSGVPTPTFASSTAATTNVTPKTPVLYTRCNTTYFATARKADIDIDNTYWTIHGELYRMNLEKNCMRQRYTDLIGIINDNL